MMPMRMAKGKATLNHGKVRMANKRHVQTNLMRPSWDESKARLFELLC